MNRARAHRLAATAAGAVLLAATLTGCNQDVARPSAVDVASPAPQEVPADFCGITSAALPGAWVLPELDEDPYDLLPQSSRATCILSTGYEGDEHTTVIVTWKPQRSVEDSAESLKSECDRIGRVSSGMGLVAHEDNYCQGIEDADRPRWTLLAYSDPARPGVVIIRVDTTNPNVRTTLVDDTRRFAADVIAAIPA